MNQTKLKLRQIEVFSEIYRWHKISTAAERLSLTQSAVSMHLKQLEDVVGTSLFDRTTRSLSPTTAAHDLQLLADRLLRDARLAESMFKLNAEPAGRVCVAATPTLAMTLLPRLIREFQDLHPHVNVDLLDCGTEQFIPIILSGQADFGVGFPGRDVREFDQVSIVEDHLCFVCLAGDPIVRMKKLRWADVAPVPLVLLNPGYGIRNAIDDAARQAGVKLKMSHEVSLLTTALALTAAGVGYTIAPSELIAFSGFRNLVSRRIIDPEIKRNIAIVSIKNRSMSPSAQAFSQLIKDSMRRPAFNEPPLAARG